MTTTPNFNFLKATTSDVVDVVGFIDANFTSIDSVLAVSHTGTGELKANLVLQSPTLVTPTLSGTVSGGTIIASTGKFNTITATGGSLAVNSFTIGTYTFPGAIGSTGNILVVSGTALVFQTNTPNTGASAALDNLASVNINTSLNSFTASVGTFVRIISTSGSLTGMSMLSATTGTMSANFTVVGTLQAGAVNCTGGSITAGNITVGTYSMPTTLGTAGQVLSVLGSTMSFNSHKAIVTRTSILGGIDIADTSSNYITIASAALDVSSGRSVIIRANPVFTVTGTTAANLELVVVQATTAIERIWVARPSAFTGGGATAGFTVSILAYTSGFAGSVNFAIYARSLTATLSPAFVTISSSAGCMIIEAL